jgi:hypothetical protein
MNYSLHCSKQPRPGKALTLLIWGTAAVKAE